MTTVDYGPDPAALRRRLEAAEAEVARLKRAAAWLPDGAAPELTLDQLRGIKTRWATGPEDFQADADALIGTAERLTRERDEAIAEGIAFLAERTAAWIAERDQLRAEVARLRAVVDAFDRIAWMAEQYTEAGGSSGPEMRDYRDRVSRCYAEAMEVRATLDGEVPRG